MDKVLNWKPEYSVGDAFINGQHQGLFEIANSILASSDRLAINKFLFQLFRYTREHFIAEEDLMKTRGCTGLEAHRNEHHMLIEKLSTVVAHSSLDDDAFHQEIYSLMKDWVLVHILEWDMRIAKP